ncbi:MAG: DNA polymerase III subunit gamma/tau [Methylococcales bacterium]|nr:DNA polymerase III subunit gamma/tau [Methylococcales bacterium]
MTYQVLARKWRPQNFNEIVGQEHVSNSLINALQHQRLHHAYLFTGTRGVGKTTIARILAKAMNCENLQDSNPCGQCPVCRDFDKGRFMDLIEVDAASRTKVEDTRDLLDNAQYAPNQGRYKVYLIDEVHMLSNHSFNALLKTLEEPPPHVKFLLATTDPQKIPVTVLSRCLQFNLKQLLPEQIEKQMGFILQQEKIEFDLSALSLIARAADGSMRDGLSLLDQAIAFGQGRVNQLDVSTMLGTVSQQPIDDLLRVLVAGNGQGILDKIADIAALSVDFSDVLEQLLRMLHRLALLQVIPNFNDPAFDKQMLVEFSELISPEDVQLYYQIALKGQADLDLAPDARMGFEMVMLRMLTFRPITSRSPSPPKLSNVSSSTNVINSTVSQKVQPPIVPNKEVETLSSIEPTVPESHCDPTPAPVNYSVNNDWAEMIRVMALSGLTKQLADNCILIKIDEHFCYLERDPTHTIAGAKSKEKLEAALQNYYQKPLRLQINAKQAHTINTPAIQQQQVREDRQQAAVDSINSDPNVYALKENFDARIMPGTIVPIDPSTTFNNGE